MDKDQALKRIAKGASIVFIGMIISKFITYFYRLMIARYLGAEGYGLLYLGFAVLGIVTPLASIGLASGVIRYVAYYKGKGDEARIKGTITSALKMTLPITIVLGILMFLFAEQVSVRIFDEPRLTEILRIFSVLVPVVVVGFLFEKVIDAFQRIHYRVYVRNLWESSFQVLLTVAVLLLGYGVTAVAGAYMVTIITSFVLLVLIVEFKIFPVFKSKIVSVKMHKELLLYSWPLIFVAFFQSITNYVDSLFIGAIMSAYYVGLYNAALPTAMLTLIMPVSLTSLFLPVTSELYAKGKKKEIGEVYGNMSRWTVMFNLPIILLLMFFSSTILEILFGEVFQEASTAMVILVVGYFVYSLFFSSVFLIQAIKRTKLIFLNTALSVVLNVVLNMTLIPLYGINGAAAATASSFCLLGIMAVIQVYFIYGMQPFNLKLVKLLIAGIVAIVFLKIVWKYLVFKMLFLMLGVNFLVFSLAYVGMLFLLRCFQEEDFDLFRALLVKLGLR
jgi:O-antigen/teichoic acid export membrane protein